MHCCFNSYGTPAPRPTNCFFLFRSLTPPPWRRDDVFPPARQGIAALCCFLCWWSDPRSKRLEHPTFDSPRQQQPLTPRAASTSSCAIPATGVHLGGAGEHRPFVTEASPALLESCQLRGGRRPRWRRRCCVEGVADGSFSHHRGGC